MITGKMYDYLKWLAQIVLPAFGALYFALAGLWGLPAAEQVAGTVLAVDAFLGVLLGISQVNYGKQVDSGYIHAETSDGKTVYSLELEGDPANLVNQKEARFKIKTPS